MTRDRPGRCLNCGSDLVREYCAECGQRNVDHRVPARALAADAIEDTLSLDSRMARTVVPFLLRPGFLAQEWSAGRRARYSSPLRLYLLASAVFFLSASLGGGGAPELGRDGNVLVRPRDGGRPAAAGGAAVVEMAPPDEEKARLELRGAGRLGRLVEERWARLAAQPRGEREARLGAAFREWVPRVMFFLVPASMLVLALLWRRRWLSEHLVFSLHVHAFAFAAFAAMTAAGFLPWPAAATVLRGLLALALPAYLLVALRRFYGDGWRRTVLKAAAGTSLYLLALGAGLAGVGILVFALA